MTKAHTGACHCGAIGYVYRTEKPPSAWTIRACQCGFCRAHNVVTTSDPNSKIEFTAREPDLRNRYRFGERTADFLVCRRCGVYIGAAIETPAGTFGIVNLNALQEKPAALPEPAPMEYGAESKAERIGRRELRWSPATLTFHG